MATPALDIARMKRGLQIATFRSEENAYSWAARLANAIVLLGDAGEFWVTTMALADRLMRAGYELAPTTLGS